MRHLVVLQTAQLEAGLTQTYDESLEQYHHILQDYAKPIVLYLLLLYKINNLSKYEGIISKHDEKEKRI